MSASPGQASCSGVLNQRIMDSTVSVCTFIWLQLGILFSLGLQFYFVFLGWGFHCCAVFCFFQKELKVEWIGKRRGSGKIWERERI